MPVSHNAIAYRKARPFPDPTPFVVKNGSKMCERFSDDMPGPLSMISTTTTLASALLCVRITEAISLLSSIQNSGNGRTRIDGDL